MNKKGGTFLAIFSLFFVFGLVAVYYVVNEGTSEVVKMYYKPSDVLNQEFTVKEYLFNLEKTVEVDSFKAFEAFSLNSGYKLGKVCAWYLRNCDLDLANGFKSYFTRPNFNFGVEIVDNNFVITYEYNGEKVFEEFNVKTSLTPKVNYVLDYDISFIEELHSNCRDVSSCNDLDDCEISRCDDSSDDNYIKMELDLKSNEFIEPIFRFYIPKTEGF